MFSAEAQARHRVQSFDTSSEAPLCSGWFATYAATDPISSPAKMAMVCPAAWNASHHCPVVPPVEAILGDGWMASQLSMIIFYYEPVPAMFSHDFWIDFWFLLTGWQVGRKLPSNDSNKVDSTNPSPKTARLPHHPSDQSLPLTIRINYPALTSINHCFKFQPFLTIIFIEVWTIINHQFTLINTHQPALVIVI